ncbi:hypothetical protein K491DRAFT_171692 [Lophiostoma macrostomum CBS 122681]|uniref:Uncharacterized protein n=1 Tax=Lophiostoma macrostomum CBS 122681 TaxID=1314788 RepID=A0A6A6ST44_9PLEO|nr:hypothetical protein K491DRAFT_171692 [Lophiostoma macrostomum CBS 122681]
MIHQMRPYINDATVTNVQLRHQNRWHGKLRLHCKSTMSRRHYGTARHAKVSSSHVQKDHTKRVCLAPQVNNLLTQPIMSSALDHLRSHSMSIEPNGTFFTKLNYDVRTIIYDHMILPPIGDGKNYKGFLLSCRQAYLEAEEFAPKMVESELQRFKTRVAAETGVPVQLPHIPRNCGFANLQTVSISFSYPDMGMSDDLEVVQDRARKTTGCLLDLMSSHFKKINIIFHGGNRPPNFTNALEHRKFNWHLRLLTWDLQETIQSCRWFSNFLSFNSLRRVDGRPPAPVNTSQLVLSWDFRESGRLAQDTTLNGSRYQHRDYIGDCGIVENRPWFQLIYGDNDSVGEVVANGCNLRLRHDRPSWQIMEHPYVTSPSSEGTGEVYTRRLRGIAENELLNRQCSLS